MKALQCEMCGSQDLVKDGGVFVCQSCGTKYTVEEAKKMMVEGTVDVKGTVKVDTSDELKNLYEIARRAKDADNSDNAAKYYDMILVKDPSSWEANFYTTYYQVMNCKIAEISNASSKLNNCLQPVFELLNNSFDTSNEQDNEKKAAAIIEIYKKTTNIGIMLYNAARNTFYDCIGTNNESFAYDYIERLSNTASLLYSLGDNGIVYFGEDYGVLSAEAWKAANKMFTDNVRWVQIVNKNWRNIVNEYSLKIQKYDSSYKPEANNSPSSGSVGCYVATAVYGSYDCPEVWTLRRFRDYTLDESWYGRLFIKTYYAISPTFVKYFGNVKVFKVQGKKILDRWVAKLNSKGFDNTPYKDKY